MEGRQEKEFGREEEGTTEGTGSERDCSGCQILYEL